MRKITIDEQKNIKSGFAIIGITLIVIGILIELTREMLIYYKKI